jgi:hypothetical protein
MAILGVPEICLQQKLRRFPVSELNTRSNGKVFNMKVIGNFHLILIDIKFIQNGGQLRCGDPIL